jgi:outer membrane protein assembly factor BamE
VDKLKVGQTKVQVRQLLGTPLVVSLFRDSRWDYVYEFTRQGSVREHRTFTVYFVDDKLARWEGDEMPASVAELNKSAAAITAGESAWSDPRSWWEKVVDVFKN